MTVRTGIDYLSGVTPQDAKGHGVSFVCRYVSNLTLTEAKELTALGLDVVCVFEAAATEARSNSAQGAADAAAAFPRAWSSGMPKGRPIMFAVDFDDTLNPGEIVPYFEGVSGEAIKLNGGRKGTRGAYGGLATMGVLFDRGLIDFGWQTSAWSSEGHPLAWDHRAQLHQVSYHPGYDDDEAVAADFGAWNTRPPKPPAPKYPTLTTLQREELGSMLLHLPAIIAHHGAITKDQFGQLRVMRAHLDGIPGVK